jgi:hypothetical protein
MNNRSVFLIFLVVAATLLLPPFAQPQETPEQPEPPPYEYRHEVEIKASLERVLSSSEYRRLDRTEPEEDESETEESNLPNWLERLIDWLAEWLSSSQSDEETADIQLPSFGWLRWAVYAVVAVVLTLIIAFIVKAILERASLEREAEPSPGATTSGEVTSTPPGELPSQEYLRRALAFAETGDYKAAIRELLLGTMSWIERHDLIRYRRGLSNRDYIRAVRSRTPLVDALSRIVLHFERVYFGRRDASKQGFQECLNDFRKAFEAE